MLQIENSLFVNNFKLLLSGKKYSPKKNKTLWPKEHFLPDSRHNELPRWLGRLKIIDSTTVTLFSNLVFNGVGRDLKLGKKKGGTKVHTVINANEGIPCDIKFTSAATLASWNWSATKMQDFENKGKVDYPEHKSNYALLVAASTTRDNYRHQADILNVYQILKYPGYDDDHIVLIMQDDLANNSRNPYKGEVRRYDGKNLYIDVNVDYKLKALESGDIVKILMGQKSSRLKHVIEADSSTNVLVYWSGHGAPDFLAWGEKSAFTYSQMEATLNELHESAKYRKMLWLVEACFSASVCQAAEDSEIPGVMCITAANENETSKADVYNNDYGVYMTNRFTKILTGLLSEVVAKKQAGETPDMPFSDIYYYLFKYTLGSHVTVVNASNFDNLYTAGIREFIVPMK